MQKEKNKNYYIGLDIGTDSVGYAVTDEEYNLLKFNGEPAWGVTVFDEATTGEERRGFRTARRRLERRKHRTELLKELFAEEIAHVDARFFKRLQESALHPEDKDEKYSLFNDESYNDVDYHKEYPTIHHLIYELMTNTTPHDVRFVYLACAYLVAHRGHFLSNIGSDESRSFTDFSETYKNFKSFFENNGYSMPWNECDEAKLGDILKAKTKITVKKKELTSLLYGSKKPAKEPTEDFPFSRDAIISLLSGSKVHPKELFCNEEYAEAEKISLCLDDEAFNALAGTFGDDFDLLFAMRMLYDWSVLADILKDSRSISEAKIKVYERHEKDLALLKRIVGKYKREKYSDIFRASPQKGNNYAAYVYHTDGSIFSLPKKCNKEDFSKFLLGMLKNITPDEEDKRDFDDMLLRLESQTFLPKQKDSDNRVIPHQLYLYELKCILKNAEGYLPFLSKKDSNGVSVAEKIESTFLFRIPHFVGPLNKSSKNSWVARSDEKIYPWNFREVVNTDESERAFISWLTNTCTYIPGEPVLPKWSLLYHKYTVLNEINNIKINGERISVELKQRIYNEVFLQKKKVTRKFLVAFLVSNGIIEKGEEESVSGIDVNINSNLEPQIAFKRLIESGILTEDDVEKIISRGSFAEDKSRLLRWILKEYPGISEADRKYICSLKFKDFGRLSKRLLSGLEGVNKETGEVTTVIGALWGTQFNLMEIIESPDRFTFKEDLEKLRREYYSANPMTLSERLDSMYISTAVKRPIYRTLDILKDVEKAFGKPAKIFVEVTRGATEEQKNKRTETRKQQIFALYEKCDGEDVRLLQAQLEAMGDSANTLLQSEKLFLYYMQLGRCMYTGTPISLEELKGDRFNIEHIYPQAFVKDDSIINNKVLVLSTVNGQKSNEYPISAEIRGKMRSMWEHYRKYGLISEEKYKRLVRDTRFTEDEKFEFINRQLTQTSQSVKAVATLLKEKYPNAKVVYSKASVVSDFRKAFEVLKSREFNDLHHAQDAYLNIVVGNVYDMKFFAKQFDVNSDYSVNIKPMFTHPLVRNGKTVWDGTSSLEKVRRIVKKNNAHFTVYSYIKTGKLFDIQPKRKSDSLVPLKKGLDPKKYGGYGKPAGSFFVPVKYTEGKKTDIIFMAVEILHAKRFLSDVEFAKKYSVDRLKYTFGKDVENIEFPLGIKPLKINTVLSFDGFKMCISGTSNKGANLILKTVTQFSADEFWRFYLKKLSSFKEKLLKNSDYVYSERYDNISKEKNLELYMLYIDKLENSIYSKRCNTPTKALKSGLDKFKELSIAEQATALLNIHTVFGRLASGVDLTLIGGSPRAGACVFNSRISGWKKQYDDVRIINSSASGLWKKSSENLLDLI